MSLIRPTSNVDRGSSPAPAPAPGGGGDWTILTPSDLQTDGQAFQSFTLSASAQAGFDNRVEMVANTTGSFNNFFRENVGVLFFDTGFTLNDLSDGNGNIAVFQIAWEPYNMQAGSTYQTDIAFPLGVCLFSSLSAPPYNSGLKGGFYGHGFLHTKSGATLIANDSFVRRMRNQSTAGLRGAIFTYTANKRVQSLVHTLTVSKTETGGNKSMMMTQGDFNLFSRDTTNNKDQVSTVIGQQTDLGQTNDAADTVKLGVMFNLFIDAANGGTNPSSTKSWDFNLKFRKLNAGA
jgi:hypothetical protein